MSYCLNVACQSPQNPDDGNFCQSCGSKLLLKGRYRAIKAIGQGGFGKTFLGMDLDKPSQPVCVIKLFLPLSQTTDSIPKAVQLFSQEAERLDSLKHSQIPTLFAYFEEDGKLYLVEEYIPGKNLAQILEKEGIFTEIQVRELLQSLLPVVQFLHENNVIHRDIKPENIIRNTENEYVLVDFGAAKSVQNTELGKTGTIIGDPRYMADEHLQGKAIFASDIYSLGLTCLNLLTHVEPWNLFNTNEGEWVWRDFLINPLGQDLGQILDKMIQKAIKRRFQSVAEILAAINSVKQSSPEVLTRTLSGNHYGYRNEKGQLVIAPRFDYAGHFCDGLAWVRFDGKYAYINTEGEVVSEVFDNVGLFSEGLAWVEIKGRFGYINTTGQIVNQLFDNVGLFSEGLAWVETKGKFGYMDKLGNFVITPHFEQAWDFLDGFAQVKVKNKYGYIDKKGRIVSKLFDSIESFFDGLAIAKLSGKDAYINKKGEIVGQLFDEVNPFSEGLARVKLQGKYGYINPTGKIVIPLQFYEAEDFKRGRARVSKRLMGLMPMGGQINLRGEWIDEQ